ncbi:MAG: N-formylglutamate amidohydrolase [Alphaproteobacteria bacterium]|nr:N-formylglutamate amidohydrolase [Alphaproteobacteria bacterium]
MQEFNPYTVINADSSNPLILTCEHASAQIPAGYGNLGLTESELDTHIARDKGCGRLTEMLAQQLGCTAFLADYSRLFIDYNRRENEESLILAESDGVVVAGNKNITAAEREFRLAHFHRPYYRAIAAKIQSLKTQNITPVIFSVHGFTPQLKGGAFRPWNAGILYVKENPFALYLLGELQKLPNMKIEANVPYDMRKYNTGAAVICSEDIGLQNAVIEIRDTEFENIEAGAEKWCKILSRILCP